MQSRQNWGNFYLPLHWPRGCLWDSLDMQNQFWWHMPEEGKGAWRLTKEGIRSSIHCCHWIRPSQLLPTPSPHYLRLLAPSMPPSHPLCGLPALVGVQHPSSCGSSCSPLVWGPVKLFTLAEFMFCQHKMALGLGRKTVYLICEDVHVQHKNRLILRLFL